MNDLDLRHIVLYHPDRGEIPVACVLAFCLVESTNNEGAYRPEPTYKWLVGDIGTMPVRELWGQRMSWGLMQVMGATARELGFQGTFFTELCNPPELGLKYGMLYLRKLYKKYGDWPDAIASYNAGHPEKNKAGQYMNQTYVDKILKAWGSFEPVVPLKESEA